MKLKLLHPNWRMVLLAGLAASVLLSAGLMVYYRQLIFLALPLALLLLLQLVHDYRPVFFLMLAALPWSVGVELGGGTSLDLPAEPLMLLFLFIFMLRLLGGKQLRLHQKIYPFHLLIFLLLFWTAFTTLISAYPLRSLKFLLAKLWYLAAFVYMGEYLIRDFRDVKRLFWAYFIPLMLVIVYVTLAHAQEGFSFESSNGIVHPPFPNGVIYGASLALFLPYAWYARSWYSPKSLQWYVCWLGVVLILLGIALSYKRGAWLAAAMLPVIYLLLKRRWFEKTVYAVLILAAIALGYLLHDNTFYRYAPDYERTIWHEGDIRGHLEATFSGTEISGMERFYRWVAAKNMIAAKPLTGFGPSTFNQVYKQYADDAFRTYVSDNPEQSTTHNYFLMTLTEQGIVGGLLFGLLCLYMLIKAARLYHRCTQQQLRILALTCLLSLCTVIFHSLLNEMIEVDKVGPMFWLTLLLIHKTEVWHENKTWAGQA
ncbi:MAG: hypothetical protein D6730_19215 [Bacteroidetes bacterium]|nr:MAG: hypothetical protein D6730_19215 [Bacteroidota bacterium]